MSFMIDTIGKSIDRLINLWVWVLCLSQLGKLLASALRVDPMLRVALA
jgi:hypothetical protein